LSRGGVRCCFVNRTLAHGALISCVVGIYVFVVGYLGALFRTGGNLPISLVATGIVAVLFAPLRDRLQRAANRLSATTTPTRSFRAWADASKRRSRQRRR
jgi:hypothetical protein